jgi:non-ribosomal peptide synthetase component E (peptide arylation enzyme)
VKKYITFLAELATFIMKVSRTVYCVWQKKSLTQYYNAEIILHYNTVVGQVIGVPDSRMGEEVCACLRLVEGAKLTADQVKQYCKGKV